MRSGAVRTTFGLAALSAVAVVVWFVVLAIAPVVIGWRPTVLTGGSMSPALRAGDVVLAAPPSGGPLDEGTIVVFDVPGGRITHRVVAINAHGSYTTKGDANLNPDSTPVLPHQVVGRAGLVVPGVGLPYVWIVNGQWGHLFVTGVGGLVLAYIAWLGLRPRRSASVRTGGRTVGRSTRRLALRVTAVLALLTMAASAARDTSMNDLLISSRAAFSAAADNGSNSLAAAGFFPHYLKTEGSGDTTSTPVLPLNTTTPTAATLPNYDTNRNPDPGLTILETNTGLNESMSAKYQKWTQTTDPSGLTLSGSATLTFWSAVRLFNPSAVGAVEVGLYDCDASETACTLFASASLTSSGAWSGGSTTWVEKTLSFGTVNRTIASGRLLVMKLVVPLSSSNAMWFAYDTTSYPSRLEVG